MKTVSQGYKAAQASNLFYPVRKVELFRMLADGSGWEAASTDVTSEVVTLDRLSWKLDTDALNEFKTSNINIEFDNSNRQWDDGSPGRFAGYLRPRSKIRISLGLTISGAPEIFPVFTGIIGDSIEDSAKPTAKINVFSMDQVLAQAISDNAGILVQNELLGHGDGVNNVFPLSRVAVGVIKQVRVNGIVVKQGDLWSSSGINNPAAPASVNFNDMPPLPGQEVRADYVAWKTNQKMEQVARDLVNSVPQVQASEIDPVVFGSPIQEQILHTRYGDFSPYFLAQAAVVPEPLPAPVAPTYPAYNSNGTPSSTPKTPAAPKPTDDSQLTINAYDSAAKWQAAFSLSRINTTRLPGGIHPRWTAQYEADFDPGVEKVEIDGDISNPWQELLTSGQSASNSGSIRTIVDTTGGYLLWNATDDISIYNTTPYPGRGACCRIRFNQFSGEAQMQTYVRVSPTLTLGAILRFIDSGHVRVQSGGQNPQIAVDLTQFHVFLLVMTPTSATAATYQLFIDGVSVQTGSMGSEGTLGSIALYTKQPGNFIINLDWIRYNAYSAGPAVGEIIIKANYGPYLAGLTNFSLITTLGPFFALLQGSASGAKFLWSWSADDLTYSAETSVSNGGNIGAWSNVNSPSFIKFHIILTDPLDPITQFGVQTLWLPALAASPVVDGGSGVVSWDTWQADVVPGNGSVQFFTASQDQITGQITFYKALGPGNTILSGIFQQSQNLPMPEGMVFIALMTTTGATAPLLAWSLFSLTTSTVLITMAQMNSRTVWDVLEELATIADYYIGMDSSGNFFFKDKVTSPTSLLTLDNSNVLQVQSFGPGWDRVFNWITASFGSFSVVINSASQNEPAPTSVSRFGVRPYSTNSGQLLYQTDEDLATLIGQRYFNRYKEPKRTAVVIARYMPEVELGDHVSYSVFIPRQIGQPFDARVVGIAHDLMKFTTELDLMEI